MRAGANNGDRHGRLVCVLASSLSLLLPSKIISHIFATINQLLSDGCCSNNHDNSHQPSQGSYLTDLDLDLDLVCFKGLGAGGVSLPPDS